MKLEQSTVRITGYEKTSFAEVVQLRVIHHLIHNSGIDVRTTGVIVFRKQMEGRKLSLAFSILVKSRFDT